MLNLLNCDFPADLRILSIRPPKPLYFREFL